MEPNKDLVKFIKEARKRGFDDYQIRAPLVKQGWPEAEIDCAFNSLKKIKRAHFRFKNKVTIYLDNDLAKIIEKRAKKNMLTLPEQIEDILRRSCISMKNKYPKPAGKIDDVFINIFSRQRRGSRK